MAGLGSDGGPRRLSAWLATLEEVVVRQPHAYLGPGSGTPRWAAALTALGGAALGVLGGYLGRRQHRVGFVLVAVVAALVAGASGTLLWLAFTAPAWWAIVTLGLPAVGGAVLGAGAVCSALALGPELAETDVVARWVRPLRLLGAGVLLGLCAALSARAGLVRSAATLGLVWAVIAGWWTVLRPGLVRWRWVCGAVFLGNAVLLGASARLSPPGDVARFPAEVVYARTSNRGHYVVTSAQDHFNLFVGGQLEASTLDEHRYYEALVHPAMQTARERRRVLLLGGGKGLAEREILRHPEVSEVVVVLVDRTLLDLGRRMRWLSRRSLGALSDPRLRVVEAEPIVWLGESSDRFDVVLVDLPDPDGYFQGKNCTRFFYRALRRRVRPDGAVAVQATSLGRSPRSFALIEETLRHAGWSTLAYHAPIVTLGDWGFVLASERAPSPPTQVPAGTRFLTSSVLGDLFRMPRDLPSSVPPGPNLLHDQRLVDQFEQERPP